VILEKINSVEDLRKLDLQSLKELAADVRNLIIETTSKNGGHLAPSLGVVDLTIALHCAFNTPVDRLIWDVGHQTYAHKIITGRRDAFHTIRTLNGLSGFPKKNESEYDTYDCGHSSTSLSLAIGEAVARDLMNETHRVIAVIGDGSLTGGMVYEALNQIGDLKKDLIIILNDNDHSISKNVGAMSEYLTKIIVGNLYNKMIRKLYRFLNRLPLIGKAVSVIFNHTKVNLKSLFVPKKIFEDLGVRYFGPIDGHNIENMIQLFNRIKDIDYGPKIIHVRTRKGFGYNPAEKNPEKFHGVEPFNVITCESSPKKGMTYSLTAGTALCGMAEKNNKIVAVTAAMTSGTGLAEFSSRFPDRFFDVGIAEGHAVAFSAALANRGLKPYFAVYSTFLQRGYDQLIHDIGIMNLPVTLLVDRAGLVGDDGETHQGLFDVSYLRTIPNYMVLSPSCGRDLVDMLNFSQKYNGPLAIRYPRGVIPEGCVDFEKFNDYFPSANIISDGKDILIISLGDMFDTASHVKDLLEQQNISCSFIDINCIKPIPFETMESYIKKTKYFITIENAYVNGGFGEYLLSSIKQIYRGKCLNLFGFPNEFITHGKTSELFDKYGLVAEKISAKIIELIQKNESSA